MEKSNQTKLSNESLNDNNDQTEAVKEDNTALFDQPLVLEGKRKRKSTELFSFAGKDKLKKTAAPHAEYMGGEGIQLGDIPYVEHSIGKSKYEQLGVLFKLCYDRVGKKREIKRCLRDFSGFPSLESTDKKHAILDKMVVQKLKGLCDILGIETSGKKLDMINRIIEFLTKPVDTGKVPSKRTRSSSGATSKRKLSMESDEDVMEDEVKSNDGDNTMDNTCNDDVKEGVVNTAVKEGVVNTEQTDNTTDPVNKLNATPTDAAVSMVTASKEE